ncbi:MAG: hypothetical protein IT577_11390 [Verrucomicrobiae bacterium]|nr:hypothetical protein [Verrucomicrobiae bacterium]
MRYGIAFTGMCIIACSPLAGSDVDVLCVHADGRVEKMTRPLTQEGQLQRFRWKAAEIPPGLRHVEIHPRFATANTGEEGYFVMPNGFLGTFRERDGEYALAGNPMPMFGMKTPRGAFVGIVTGLPHAYTLVARAKDGSYELFPRFQLDGRAPYDDIAIDFRALSGDDANYSGMARAYRRHQLDRKACVPLRERVRHSPELAYAAQSIEVRIRQGWKPAPSPVEEQAPDTEPPMRVAVTFDRVGEILDEFKRQGIERAEICLVGWNQKGHDGRYPQLFPVEGALGGEARLRHLIKKARQMGFQIVAHTNSSDAYRISADWDEEYIIKDANQALSKNACWSGGRMYNVCPRRAHERFAPRDLRAVADLGFRGIHYIDVLTIVRPRACHDPRHPLDPNKSAEWIGRIMGLAKDTFGGVASEGPYDFCCGNLDYVLYVSFGGLTKVPKMIDRVVPIWQLAYHGIIMSNPFTETANYTIKGDRERLKLVEFGGRPMFYFHSKFMEGDKQWMGAEDITCGDDASLAAGVAQIKKGHDEFKALCGLQLEFMERHEMVAPDIFRTAYSDGSEIITNYRDSAFEYSGRTVRPRSYIVVPGERR